jgi:phospholipid-binding lipoprotein MlaA
MVTTHMRFRVICFPDARMGDVFRTRLGKWLPLTQRSARNVRSHALIWRWIGAGLLGLILTCPGYAQVVVGPFNRDPRDPIEQGKIDSAYDPFEALNREIFKVNKFLDDTLIKPVARAYVEHVPEDLRKGIHNFTNNVGEPVVFANDILQGNVDRAWNTTQRFAVNTTIGVVGFVDVADTWGRPHHDATLGQTFGVWGFPAGPAVQLPILGPSNLRDALGLGATSAAIPLAAPGAVGTYVSYGQLGSNAVDNVDYRSKLLPNTDALEKSSQDLYASTRLIKAQLRAKFVEEGKAGRVAR